MLPFQCIVKEIACEGFFFVSLKSIKKINSNCGSEKKIEL